MLTEYADCLEKPVIFFYPSVQESNLTEQEQLLPSHFRRLEAKWQAGILELVKGQVVLYEATAEARSATWEIEQLPEEQREDAAYRFVRFYG